MTFQLGNKLGSVNRGRNYKDLFRGGLSKWKEDSYNHFKIYGWTLIFFDETEISRSKIVERLGGN